MNEDDERVHILVVMVCHESGTYIIGFSDHK